MKLKRSEEIRIESAMHSIEKAEEKFTALAKIFSEKAKSEADEKRREGYLDMAEFFRNTSETLNEIFDDADFLIA